MSSDYWKQREDEILAFRDYAVGFDLASDLAGGVDLAESGDQLLEIAWQLAFVGRGEEGLALARKAVDYYQAALPAPGHLTVSHKSRAPLAAPRMAHVYHGLYYARWWITGAEPLGLLRQAAGAFTAGLGQPPIPEDADLYLRAARLWLEAGDVAQAEGWLRLADWAAGQACPEARRRAGPAGTPANLPLAHLLVQAQREAGLRDQACAALAAAIARAIAWGQPGAGTFWQALQLANIRRQLCGPPADLPGLLQQIR